jgi:hypothetical protein
MGRKLSPLDISEIGLEEGRLIQSLFHKHLAISSHALRIAKLLRLQHEHADLDFLRKPIQDLESLILNDPKIR